MQRIRDRGHIYIEGIYIDQRSPLIVFCPEHGTENGTTFNNYRRSRTGCHCCGRERVSNALTNRQYSEETLKLMSPSGYARPSRGGRPRRWREEARYRGWRRKVLQLNNSQCAVSGKKTKAGKKPSVF